MASYLDDIVDALVTTLNRLWAELAFLGVRAPRPVMHTPIHSWLQSCRCAQQNSRMLTPCWHALARCINTPPAVAWQAECLHHPGTPWRSVALKRWLMLRHARQQLPGLWISDGQKLLAVCANLVPSHEGRGPSLSSLRLSVQSVASWLCQCSCLMAQT